MNIAVFIDAAGNTASLYQPGRVRVYESRPAGWQAVREIPFSLNEQMGLAEIRTRTLAMLASLAGCRHFVARSIHGALLSYFDGMGIVMWKLEGDPLGFLPQIRQRVEHIARQALEQERRAGSRFIQPVGAPGHYRLNLIEALNSDSALTSKQVLLPFLRQGEFNRLELICDHLPKWFERELPALKLTLTADKQPDGRCRAVLGRGVPFAGA